MKRGLIIGAGPGGLTAALALRKAGIEPVVFERAPARREAGSGLTLWPNALMALGHLGVLDGVRPLYLPMQGIAIRSWRGEVLNATSRSVLERSCGGLGGTVHRRELLEVLLDLLGDQVVHEGAECMGFHQDDAGVTAVFADGLKVRGDFLIGADGIKSVIARQLFGDAKVRYAGYPVWRGVAEFILPETAGMMSMGLGAHFGLFPLTHRRVYWFASFNAPRGSVSQGSINKRGLIDRFGDWHEPIRAVLEATDEAMILVTKIYDRQALRSWGRGRVTLTGDAAHASVPNLGQGACQAMEDAAVLGICLSRRDEVTAALREYERRRMGRANAMLSQARWMSWLGQWERRPACWLREQFIKRMPEKFHLQYLRWLFCFQAR